MRFPQLSLSIPIALLTSLTPLSFNVVAAPLTVPQMLAQIPNARQTEADRLFEQGGEQYQHNQFEAALKSWQQALTLYLELKDDSGEKETLIDLGNAYLNLGDYAAAVNYFQQRLAVARATKDQLGQWFTLRNLELISRALVDYPKTIDYLQQRLAIARDMQFRAGEMMVLNDLGLAYDSLGDYAKAIDYHQQSLAIARSIKNQQDEEGELGIEGEEVSLGNLGSAYNSLGDYAKAIDYNQQGLAIARSIQDRNNEAVALGELGLAYYYLRDYAKAIAYYQQSLAIARSIKDETKEANQLNNLGLALLDLGKFAEAEKFLLASIQISESLRTELGNSDTNKVLFFEKVATTYRLLQEALIAQNKTDSALEIAERGRARAFVELLAQRQAPSNSVQKPITPLNIQQIKQIAKQQNATLVEYSILFDKSNVQGKQQFKASELYIWVIKPTGEVTFRSSNLKPLWQQQNTTLAELVTTSRDSIGVRGRDLGAVARVDGASQTHHLQQLHQLLIQPIANLLPTDPTAHIIFIPQQELFLVPFPALQDASGQYLIQNHTILTAPAIAVLDLTHQRRQHVPGSARDVLVVGNPTMPLIQPPGHKPTQLPSLAGAEQEAKTIATLFNTQALIKNQATKASIVSRLPQAKIIHLATHGLLDDFQGGGVPGAIALAPSKPGVPNDGLLTSNEILDLKLNAELVVLSACDTGRGKLTGDGVIGLSRSLITAGVPSIIVSLWSIPDAPTAQLMSEFYQNLQKNPDKAIALRQAMLKTMEKYPQPQNWAAFTLIGESN